MIMRSRAHEVVVLSIDCSKPGIEDVSGGPGGVTTASHSQGVLSIVQVHVFNVKMTCEGCSGAVNRVLGKVTG